MIESFTRVVFAELAEKFMKRAARSIAAANVNSVAAAT
jgi:hypothetical protein